MSRRDYDFQRHPRLVFAFLGITTVALGYVTNFFQQRWYPESYLLLHISIWWMLGALWLLHLANKPRRPTPAEQEFQQYRGRFRLEALLYGDTPSFHDRAAEVNDDYPRGTPLFRSICLSIQHWHLSSLEVSIDNSVQFASFCGPEQAQFTLQFAHWDFAWQLGVQKIRASQEQVRHFLGDLQAALSQIEGLTKIRWYDGNPDSFHAQMSDLDLESGTDSPFDPAHIGT